MTKYYVTIPAQTIVVDSDDMSKVNQIELIKLCKDVSIKEVKFSRGDIVVLEDGTELTLIVTYSDGGYLQLYIEKEYAIYSKERIKLSSSNTDGLTLEELKEGFRHLFCKIIDAKKRKV